MASPLIRARAFPRLALLRIYILISFLLFSPSSAYWLKLKWTGMEVSEGTTIDGSKPDDDDYPNCQRINKPLSSPSDSQIDAVSVLNGYDNNILYAMGLWLDLDCEGDPDVFIRWVSDDQNGVPSWQVVDLTRIGGMSTAVAKYNSLMLVPLEELDGSYADFSAPAGVGDGGYVILDGETNQILRTAPFSSGGEGPIVQYGTIGSRTSIYDPARDLLKLNPVDSLRGDKPTKVETEHIEVKIEPPLEALDGESAETSKSGQLRLQIKDKSMPVLRATGNIYDKGSTSKLSKQITQDMLQGRPNTEFIGAYEEPLPKDVADDFRKSLGEASARKGLKLEHGQDTAPTLRSLAQEEALRRAGVNPDNVNSGPKTINDLLLGPSFWPELYKSGGKDPYGAMGIIPENLQADYWNALQSNADKGGPADVLPVHQLSALIENRMFGESRDRPENIRPGRFENRLQRSFTDRTDRPVIDRSELEEPKAWADDPTQHPTYKSPSTKIEVEPEGQVKVEDTTVQLQQAQAPVPQANINNAPLRPPAVEDPDPFLNVPTNENYFKFRLRRH
ncbi:hypothetical protein AOL_s00043g665 [Orbilia oligospora ATCC 24927]|uniref:Uncharacterized protein n=1 Tax=Arthrobotrys oligospora (strain ATCC 24927 / CBS 115.81 / DSM 1491) TaxID=756982 RepID=G1X4P1_ARTOA|nr:hypothetical protein AOL_s00043g665 [Orbilia oligospora ATCC 24927]EGX51931.1 hypothetical protein AOL_s00043g665 [Orbilia oligospora ATCC 24927]